MSERMTDESLKYHRGKVDVEDGIYSYDAMQAELDRARASEEQKDAELAEKDATIKTLADALREHGAHPRDCSVWLANGDFDEAVCSCGIAAALRLAGRL